MFEKIAPHLLSETENRRRCEDSDDSCDDWYVKNGTPHMSDDDDAHLDAHDINAPNYGYGPNGDMFRDEFIGSGYDRECN